MIDPIKLALVLSIIMTIFTISISLYSLYLNYRQAKVKEQMDKLIKIAEDIKKSLHNCIEMPKCTKRGG